MAEPEFLEPWEPKVGDVVKVRLGECPWRGLIFWGGSDWPPHNTCHMDSRDGMEGEVDRIDGGGPAGHRILISFQLWELGVGHYAVAELEKVDW